MIVGLGIDVVELDRIRALLERFGPRFLERLLAPEEWVHMPTGDAAPFVAARFAAKEAAVKALGTGFARGIGLRDVRVGRLPSGQPLLELHGLAAARGAELGVTRTCISLTHGRQTAAAVVILEALP